MHALWHWLLYVLTWAAHDPATLATERARCAGAVAVAYAALAVEPAPAKVEPLPPLPPAAPCVQCSGTGRIYRSDGGWVRCSCGACSTGRCKPAKALP
jgi:hypothetical protein